MVITSHGKEKPEREEVVEPLEEPTPDKRREKREAPVEAPKEPVHAGTRTD